MLTDRDEMCNLYRGPSIDASYQVLAQFAKQFQRRRLKCEKLTDAKCSHCLWQGELKSHMNVEVQLKSISINILHSLYLSCLYEISTQNKDSTFFLIVLEKYKILG